MKYQRLVLTSVLTVISYFGTISSFSSMNLVTAAKAASKLGDLSKFKKIVIDTEALVEKGRFEQAKTRIKDLETSWDEAEAGLKPRAAADWHTIDKGIDRTLSALRADSPDLATCKKAITELINLFERTEGK